jgi:hypothetical protein
MENNKIIFFGKVTDVDDPLLIGRIRVEPKQETLAFIYPENWNESTDKWKETDPLIFNPLIPYYLSIIPAVGEYVHIIYSNKSETVDANKFYIQGPLSRPWNNKKENYNNSQSVLASGENLQQAYSPIDPKTGKVIISLTGVYPTHGDNAILGRGTADVIVKENEVLVRAGKTLSSGNNNIPVVRNDLRSFLQISSFELENVSSGTEEITNESFEDISTKTYVQWSITNLNSTSITYDGKVSVYSLPGNNDNYKVSVINQSIDLLLGQTISPIYEIIFTGKTLEQSSTIINNLIRGVNDGEISWDPSLGYSNQTISNQFPFFYGPDQSTYEYVVSGFASLINATSNILQSSKIMLLNNKISLSYAYDERGFGLVWKNNPSKLGILTEIKTTEVDKRNYLVQPITYSVLGGDKVYFLTNKSEGKFKIDLKDTLYGIPQSKLAIEIHKSTNSMVRGEELMFLLNQIVDFMLTHVHPFPGLPPIKEYPNQGVSSKKILETINNAENNILNQNIRFN